MFPVCPTQGLYNGITFIQAPLTFEHVSVVEKGAWEGETPSTPAAEFIKP
jgi:hypothetical protein